MIGSELNLNHPTIHDILTEELGMRKICAKLVPKNLTNEQKQNFRNVCLDFLEHTENDENVFKHVITGDESWISEYDPETKQQSSEWHTSNSRRPKKARMSKLNIKFMLICFFDSQGVVYKEFVHQGETVRSEVIERLRKRVHRIRSEIADTWMPHHDNPPRHTTISLNEFLTKKCIPVLSQGDNVDL
jgi:histone-lysine N-methyltransferase SETMAR